MKKGASVREAVVEGMEDLKGLKGGFQAQVVIYATDKDGEFFVARRLKLEKPSYFWVWHDGMAAPEKREAEDLG
jgi:L-asparaginase